MKNLLWCWVFLLPAYGHKGVQNEQGVPSGEPGQSPERSGSFGGSRRGSDKECQSHIGFGFVSSVIVLSDGWSTGVLGDESFGDHPMTVAEFSGHWSPKAFIKVYSQQECEDFLNDERSRGIQKLRIQLKFKVMSVLPFGNLQELICLDLGDNDLDVSDMKYFEEINHTNVTRLKFRYNDSLTQTYLDSVF